MGRVWETASDTLNAIMRQCHKIAACCRIQLGALSDFQHGHEASRGGETVLATCQFSHNLPVSLQTCNHSKEPEAHVSGACLLQLGGDRGSCGQYVIEDI